MLTRLFWTMWALGLLSLVVGGLWQGSSFVLSFLVGFAVSYAVTHARSARSQMDSVKVQAGVGDAT